MLRRLLFLLTVLSGVLATAYTPLRADVLAEKDAAVHSDEQVQVSLADKTTIEATQLNEHELAHLKGGQGCFGLGSPNCCQESKSLGAVASYGMLFGPNPWFATAYLISNIHQIMYC